KKDPDQPKKERRRPNNYGTDPWPDWPKPTPKECEEVNRLLTISEGESKRPDKLVVDTTITGCGEVPDVLDALCRTALSLNTTVENSNKALKALIDRFGTVPTEQEAGPQHRNYRGYGTVDWDAVRNVDKNEIADAIKAGGLNNYKAETIKKILDSVWKEGQLTLWQQRADVSGLPKDTIAALPHDAPGQLTLDYLHNYSDAEVMDKLTSYWGIGPKAAACVAMFSLGRNIFPVDTHVMRLSGYLGWIPEEANDKTAFYHLDARIPNELKYSLHNLLIRHGMRCKYCKGKPMKPERTAESSINVANTPAKPKKTRTVWTGNGLMKQQRVEVETDDEFEWDEKCILEHLVHRVQKAKKVSKAKKEDAKD
ncbi:DNA glycosylase, partial [Pyronema omphalodes]